MYRISNLVLAVVLLLAGLPSGAQFTADDFIITVKTDDLSGGSTLPNHFFLPAYGTYTVYFESIPAGVSGSFGTLSGAQHLNFGAPGTYKVGIRPTGATPFHRFGNYGHNDFPKLLTIEQWGTAVWSTMYSAFDGYVNLTDINATDVPNLSSVTTLQNMFLGCAKLKGGPQMKSWNTGNVTNMRQVFRDASSFNASIGSWNTSNVSDMFYMFQGASAFNQPLNNWNTGNTINMEGMFRNSGFNQFIGNWKTSQVTTMLGMFFEATSFNQDLSAWNLSSLADARYMFYNSGMNCNNYSKTLIGWAGNINTKWGAFFQLQTGRAYGSASQTARNYLINTKGWTISGDTYDAGCKVVPDPQVFPSGANPFSGPVVKNTYLRGTQPKQYVKRVYEITPVNNAATATGKVFLYFPNQDFTDFNSQSPAPAALLPDINSPATLAARKANLLIEKRGGSSTDGSGLPGSYTGTVETIDPDDLSIVWDSDASVWEVSFDVTGFSGFFVKTSSSALPVGFGDISAIFKNGQLIVNWTTEKETNNSHFEIELSADGKTFVKAGAVKSKADGGNSDSPLSYQFIINSGAANTLLGISALALLSLAALGRRRKTMLMIAMISAIAFAGAVSCRKSNDASNLTGDGPLFIRIKPTDINGHFEYSKTVRAAD